MLIYINKQNPDGRHWKAIVGIESMTFDTDGRIDTVTPFGRRICRTLECVLKSVSTLGIYLYPNLPILAPV